MIGDYYTESISIMSRTTGPAWGTETAWTTSAAVGSVAAAMNPVSAREMIIADKKTALFDYKMFCSSTVEIDEANRIKHGDHIYDVVFVKDTLDRGHHKLVYLKRHA